MTPILLAALLAAFPVQGHSKRLTPPPPPPPVVQQGVRPVPVGDPLRRTLMDALRPSIEGDLGQPVQFIVDQLKVQGDWAYYSGRPQQRNGREIDFSRTHYREAINEGYFDGPGTYALLRNVGGRWRVVTFVIGPTDVAWMGWPQEYGAPPALFGMR